MTKKLALKRRGKDSEPTNEVVASSEASENEEEEEVRPIDSDIKSHFKMTCMCVCAL